MTKRATLWLLLLTALLLLPACDVQNVQEQIDAPIVTTREPIPTPEPGVVSVKIDDVAAATALADETFLGIPLDDWIGLGLAVD